MERSFVTKRFEETISIKKVIKYSSVTFITTFKYLVISTTSLGIFTNKYTPQDPFKVLISLIFNLLKNYFIVHKFRMFYQDLS